MNTDTSTAVRTETLVEAPIERAFNTRWELEADPDRTSEVAVTFVAEGPDRTRVALEHRHLERHGEGWEGMRDAVGQGWAGLEGYTAAVEGRDRGSADS